jgi:ribose transport system ATP-binding protein
MYIGLQGVSFLLRDVPDGYINASVVEVITAQVGPIPVAFIVLALCVAAAEYALRNTRAGWQLRATGSDEESARRLGLRIDRITMLAA